MSALLCLLVYPWADVALGFIQAPFCSHAPLVTGGFRLPCHLSNDKGDSVVILSFSDCIQWPVGP